MDTKNGITKYLSFPMALIGSGSFVGIIGWMGVAHAAESIIFFIGSSLLSFSGSMATLCGLMSLERLSPSKNKLRKIKLDISKDLKIQYPSYILQVEELKQKYQLLYNKLPELRIYYQEYRDDIRNIKATLATLEKQLQDNLKNNALEIDNSADGIAKKILWSEKQIQLNQMSETFNSFSQIFTTIDLEHYRSELSKINIRLSQLERGIDNYRKLMILSHKKDTDYDTIVSFKQKIEKTNDLMGKYGTHMQELEEEMNAKYVETKTELSLFKDELKVFENINE